MDAKRTSGFRQVRIRNLNKAFQLSDSFRRFGAPSGAGPSTDSSVQPEALGAEISELSDLLRKKRAADRAQQKASMSEALPDYDTFSGSFGANIPAEKFTGGAASSSQDGNLAQIMQMNMMMQNMQRSMMIQKQMLEEETKRRETEELRMEIKKIELLILQKGVPESQPPLLPHSHQQNQGSVRARVGSKRPLPPVNNPDPLSSRIPQNSKRSEDVSNQAEERKVKKKYTNQKLPRDLIMTRFTKDGPKPANNILWSEGSKKDSFDWKRQKKTDQVEDDDRVADETSDEDED